MIRLAIAQKVLAAAGEAPPRVLFRELELVIDPGEVCAVLGPSGVGKTSLLNILAGLDRDFVGSRDGVPEAIGYLFQNVRLLPWLTARANIEIVLRHGSRDERGREASEWLERIGLGGASELHPSRLSTGMARRVGLARAMAIEPRLLLLDEPFAALDAATAEYMKRLVGAVIAAARPTTIIVTHDPADAAFADRVITLAGRPALIESDVRQPGGRWSRDHLATTRTIR